MSKARVVVHESPTAEEAHRAVLPLLAMGLEAEVHRIRHATAAPEPVSRPAATTWQISVAESEVPDALTLLEDALAPPETDTPRTAPMLRPFGSSSAAGIWTAGNAASSIAIALMCVAIHFVVHREPPSRSTMVAAGAVAPWLVQEGQWWRLASAVFLHFDLKHLVGNMSALLFLGPPLAAQIGHLRTGVLFLATGVAGNVVSQLLGSEAAIKAGASGGVCGLLGALAGVALGAMAAAADARERRPAWQTLGALAALFGMIVGVEPGRDHYAHVGGLVAGIVLGRLFGLRAPATEPA